MKLATAEDVKARMGSSANSNVLTSADSVLEAATVQLENIIGSSFARATRIDWFSYKPGRYAKTFNEISLQLTQSFVETVSGVYLSTDGLPVEQSDIAGMTPVDSQYFSTFEERGTISLRTVPKPGIATIAVEYVAGFEDNETNIPAWLKEAAISASVRILHTQSVGHQKKDILSISGALYNLLYSMVNEHIRPRSIGLHPYNTVAS